MDDHGDPAARKSCAMVRMAESSPPGVSSSTIRAWCRFEVDIEEAILVAVHLEER